LEVVRGANNSSPLKRIVLRNSQRLRLSLGLIMWCNENGSWDLLRGIWGACIVQSQYQSGFSGSGMWTHGLNRDWLRTGTVGE